MDKLKDRVAIITGAGGRGMGRAMALAMAAEGARIVAVDLNEAGARNTIDEVKRLGGDGFSQTVDVSDGDRMRQVIEQAVQRFGRLDILCNHVGDTDSRDIDVVNTPIEVWDRTMDVGLRGPFLASKYAIPHMLEAPGKGCIINTSSGAGFLGAVTLVSYAASKAALQALTRSIATSHGKRGIRCNAIATGLVLPPEVEAKRSQDSLEIFKINRVVEQVGRPEQVGAFAAFLASDDAAYITGQTIVIDGGHTIHQPWYAQSRDLHPEAFEGH